MNRIKRFAIILLTLCLVIPTGIIGVADEVIEAPMIVLEEPAVEEIATEEPAELEQPEEVLEAETPIPSEVPVAEELATEEPAETEQPEQPEQTEEVPEAETPVPSEVPTAEVEVEETASTDEVSPMQAPTAIEVHFQGVSATNATLDMEVGPTIQLQAVVYPEGAAQQAVWESNKPSAATVDANGLVTGVSAGAAYISAYIPGSGLRTGCRVTVKAATTIKPTAILILLDGQSATSATLDMGQSTTLQLAAQVEPAGSSQQVTWQSSNEAVATVDANGLVTGLSKGATNITALIPGSGLRTGCRVTVKEAKDIPAERITLWYNGEEVTDGYFEITDPYSIYEGPFEAYIPIEVRIEPEGASQEFDVTYMDGAYLDWEGRLCISQPGEFYLGFSVKNDSTMSAAVAGAWKPPADFLLSNTEDRWQFLHAGNSYHIEMNLAEGKDSRSYFIELNNSLGVSSLEDWQLGISGAGQASIAMRYDPDYKIMKPCLTFTAGSHEGPANLQLWHVSNPDLSLNMQFNVRGSRPPAERISLWYDGEEVTDGNVISILAKLDPACPYGKVAQIPLEARVEPAGASQKVEWTSNVPIVVAEDGTVWLGSVGTNLLRATTTDGTNVSVEVEIDFEWELYHWTLTPMFGDKEPIEPRQKYAASIVLSEEESFLTFAAFYEPEMKLPDLGWDLGASSILNVEWYEDHAPGSSSPAPILKVMGLNLGTETFRVYHRQYPELYIELEITVLATAEAERITLWYNGEEVTNGYFEFTDPPIEYEWLFGAPIPIEVRIEPEGASQEFNAYFVSGGGSICDERLWMHSPGEFYLEFFAKDDYKVSASVAGVWNPPVDHFWLRSTEDQGQTLHTGQYNYVELNVAEGKDSISFYIEDGLERDATSLYDWQVGGERASIAMRYDPLSQSMRPCVTFTAGSNEGLSHLQLWHHSNPELFLEVQINVRGYRPPAERIRLFYEGEEVTNGKFDFKAFGSSYNTPSRGWLQVPLEVRVEPEGASQEVWIENQDGDQYAVIEPDGTIWIQGWPGASGKLDLTMHTAGYGSSCSAQVSCTYEIQSAPLIMYEKNQPWKVMGSGERYIYELEGPIHPYLEFYAPELYPYSSLNCEHVEGSNYIQGYVEWRYVKEMGGKVPVVIVNTHGPGTAVLRLYQNYDREEGIEIEIRIPEI